MHGRDRSELTLMSRAERRLRARLHHGPLSHQVIALAATGQLHMADAEQIRLAVVTGDKSGAVPAVLADGTRCMRSTAPRWGCAGSAST